MPPDVTKRLDDRKAMLLVRGHYGVILDKLNSYTDGRFRDLAAAGDAFASKLVAPKVQLTREWPLFMPRPKPADRDATWSEVAPLPGQTLNEEARGSTGARAVADGTGKTLEEPYDEFKPDRLKISANASLAYEDDWRIQGVVEEAMQSSFDDPTATIAFNLRTKPEIYGALRGAHGLFGWDRQRRKAISAVAELRRDVLSMRHAVKERQARLAAEKKKAAAQLMPRDDVLSASAGEADLSSSELPDRDPMLDRSSRSAPLAPNASVSESVSEGAPNQMSSDRNGSSADLKFDTEESARLIDMADAVKATLTSAAERADSPQRKAELIRISEAFARTRGALSDEDRRENTLGSPSLGKRARLKKTP